MAFPSLNFPKFSAFLTLIKYLPTQISSYANIFLRDSFIMFCPSCLHLAENYTKKLNLAENYVTAPTGTKMCPFMTFYMQDTSIARIIIWHANSWSNHGLIISSLY